MKKGVTLLLAISFVSVLFLFGVTHGYADETTGLTSETIKVGIVSDITGPTSQLQVPLHTGIKTYLQYINDQGGIHCRKFKVIIEDGGYSVARDISNFKKLVYRDKIFMFFEIGSTGSGVALASQITKEGLPTMMTSTTDFFINPVRPYHFTEGTTYEDEIKIIFNYIINVLKAKDAKIALIRADTEHGKVGSRTCHEQAKAYGLKLAAEEIIQPGAIEASSQVLNLKRGGVSHVILHTTEGNAATFLRESKRFGYKPIPIGTKYACTEDVIRIVGDAAKGFVATNSFASWHDDYKGINEMRRITLKYHEKKEMVIRYRQYNQGWSQAVIMVEGLKRAGKNLTRSGLVKAIESIKDFDMGNIMASVTYGPDKHQGTDYCKMYKADIENQKFVPFTDYIRAAK